MDEVDRGLLRLLQEDNRRSSAELADEVGLSVSATSDRVRRLNASGAIVANRAIIDPVQAGFSLCAFIFVDLEPRANEEEFARALCKIPEIQEAHHITGRHSWLIKARVSTTSALQALLTTSVKTLTGVLRTDTMIALHTAKETTEMPLTDPISSKEENDPR